jgi:carbamoyl-phosphate synthase large subunit
LFLQVLRDGGHESIYSKRELDNGYKIRRAAVDYNIPLITNARLASAFIYAICKVDPADIAIKSWDEY